ncbi:MAG: helix-turn-helix domain-containing protein [Nitrospirae bacterium]|nr:helix-turn-helix domain-containing protein [Nitrospirota bacterium]
MSKKNPAFDELISLAEAEALYGLGMDYLRTISRNGRLNARKIGRNWVTTRADVEEYLRTRTKKGAYRTDIEI